MKFPLIATNAFPFIIRQLAPNYFIRTALFPWGLFLKSVPIFSPQLKDSCYNVSGKRIQKRRWWAKK